MPRAHSPPFPSSLSQLSYFPARGRAEFTRLCLSAGKVAFEDERMSFEDFGAKKASGELPMGQLPTLTVDGVQYSQSISIARYSAKISGIYPAGEVAQLKCDMVVDCFSDLRDTFAPFRTMKPEEKDAAYPAAIEKAEQQCAKIEKLLEGSGLFVGDAITMADVACFAVFEDNALRRPQVVATGFKDKFPGLAAVCDKVKAQEGIAAYLSSRPDEPDL